MKLGHRRDRARSPARGRAGNPPEADQAGQGGVLAAILPSGMRAISTRIKEETSAGRLILPNDRVDVILTRRVQRTGRPGRIRQRHAVLTTSVSSPSARRSSTKEGKKAAEGAANTATLELTPRQAELLARANSTGEISLSLRSVADGDPNGERPHCGQERSSAAASCAYFDYGVPIACVRRELSCVDSVSAVEKVIRSCERP